MIMDSDEECASAIMIALLKKKRKRKKKRLRTVSVRPWLTRWNKLGIDNILLQEFQLEDEDECRTFLRMTPDNVDELLTVIETDSQNKTHVYVCHSCQNATTLKFLVTGSNYA